MIIKNNIIAKFLKLTQESPIFITLKVGGEDLKTNIFLGLIG